MEVLSVKPSFTLKVEEGRGKRKVRGKPIAWKSEKAFRDELLNRGLSESQVSKVWRMYTDEAFVHRYGNSGYVGEEYVITRARMAGMARELGIHGKSKQKTAISQLKQLVLQAECFVTWVSDKGVLVKFASPMFYTKEILKNDSREVNEVNEDLSQKKFLTLAECKE